MRHLLMSLILLLSFTGCENKEQQAKQQAEHDAKIAQQAREALREELKAKKDLPENNASKLNKIDIHINDGTITIDTNKTKDFLRNLNKKMDTQMKKISEDLEKGILETKDAGVEINEQHIHIDLNKTQDILMNWGKQIQVFVKEFNEMTKMLETNNTNTTMKGM